ncbi:response regulator transcription factor [Alkalihalobacterium chitinilyticum]|uniref:Response regulator transcription factor n=1 Tax=Alkalihalobacterium chitinilyticum TaxID=2980103 RepID=A0ABT5VEC0_9BACI|nr:response regulator transcription factor [Alkalihalobacterium chitinilyticum]MDE5413672.1 response regulator transcription factor [Alkalihalobacterium chitinilyticum]
MKTVLLIDDEKRMLDLLELYITPYGYKCIKKTSGKEAISVVQEQNVDLILLDIMMPEMDGWTTLKHIREFSHVPIIMLTARNDKGDIVKGLKTGADDYVSKPFDEEELLARMEAVIRRTSSDTNDGTLSFRDLTLDPTTVEVHYKNIKIPMTPKEFALLELFLKYQNKVFSREHLLSTLWGLKVDTEDRTIDSHIRNLREKLRKQGFPVDDHLKTVWGIGYKWSS